MIELLLQAERALSVGLLDQAEKLYRQAADVDPRNAMAVVGLARVAVDRGHDELALAEARRALSIDPENVAAGRLAQRLDEVLRFRSGSPVQDGLAAPNGLAASNGSARRTEGSPVQGGSPARRRSLLARVFRRS